MFRGYKLRQKEVINIRTAERIGFVRDVEINESSGSVDAIIVPRRGCFVKRIFGGEMIIPWSAVEVVGDEVILVNLFEPGKLT